MLCDFKPLVKIVIIPILFYEKSTYVYIKLIHLRIHHWLIEGSTVLVLLTTQIREEKCPSVEAVSGLGFFYTSIEISVPRTNFGLCISTISQISKLI